jgi:hypothetical protein
VNRKIVVIIQRRTAAQESDPWEVEVELNYDPSALTYVEAIDTRPKIDFAMRQLRVTGDYLDAFIKEHLVEIARMGETT